MKRSSEYANHIKYNEAQRSFLMQVAFLEFPITDSDSFRDPNPNKQICNRLFYDVNLNTVLKLILSELGQIK